MHHYCVFDKEWNGCAHGHGPYNTSYIAFHPHQADLGTMLTLKEIQNIYIWKGENLQMQRPKVEKIEAKL